MLILAGLFVGVVCFLGTAVAFVEGGFFNTAATRQHNRFVASVIHTVFVRSTKRHAGSIRAPAHFSQAQVMAGFREYAADCEMCHGGPGVARCRWVSGLNPTPPYLVDAQRRWTTAQLFRIVNDGVKMTAMPAWGQSRSPDQIWSVVAFLQVLPRIAPADYARMKAAESAIPAGPRCA